MRRLRRTNSSIGDTARIDGITDGRFDCIVLVRAATEVHRIRATSLAVGDRYYTGVTSDLKARLTNHNAGRVPHTANGRPWTLDIAIQFADEVRAIKFERYLKSGSGCAFAKRHLR